MTAELAPEFLTNVSFARDVYTVDVDGDTWDDVVIINTFNQQPMLYMNLGLGEDGTWLGLADENGELKRPAVDGASETWNGTCSGFVLRELPGQQRGRHGQGLPAHQRAPHGRAARVGELLHSAFGTAGQIHDMDGDGDLDIVKNTTLMWEHGAWSCST